MYNYTIISSLDARTKPKINQPLPHGKAKNQSPKKQRTLRIPAIRSLLDSILLELSRIGVIPPADEHYNAASNDVESSSLLLHQSRALPGESASSLRRRRILDERRTGRRGAASRWSFFLRQFPLFVKVERRRYNFSAITACRHGSHG